MQAGAYFAALKQMPVVPISALTDNLPLIVLSPHPDDESLGAGGLIALARRMSHPVHVVLLTDGSGSHPRSKEYPRDRLISTRLAEAEAATKVLGMTPDCLHHLNMQDTALPTDGAQFEHGLDFIAGLAIRIGAGSLFVTWGNDPHCDHEAAALLAEEVRRRHPRLTLWAYPIWGWHLDATKIISRAPPRGVRLNISSVQAAKRSAIDCHASQMTGLISDDPDGFRFTEQSLAPFLTPHEYFIEVPA